MKRGPTARPGSPHSNRNRSATVASPRISTLPRNRPPAARQTPKPPFRIAPPKPEIRPPKTAARPRRHVGRIIDEDYESTLIDLIDNLLNKGVMLNADLVLALANVDLVYIRLSALLCAADRVMPPIHPVTTRRRGRA